MAFQDDDTIDEDGSAEIQIDPVSVETFDEDVISVAAVTNRGAVRSRNEDQYAIVRRRRGSEVLATSLDEDLPSDKDTAWLLVVADGLGGQVSGQIASATAVRAVLRFSMSLSSWIMRPVEADHQGIEERVALYADSINQEMQNAVEVNPGLAGMATTVTSAYLFGSRATVVNVGDSRSYLIRNGSLQQLTRDHTLAQQLQDGGLPEEVTHAYRNVLTRCFDTSGKPANFDVFHVELRDQDRILLCSDGLTDMIEDEEILRIVSGSNSTSDACRDLTDKAIRNGGKDNITIVMAQVVNSELGSPFKKETVGSTDSTIRPA